MKRKAKKKQRRLRCYMLEPAEMCGPGGLFDSLDVLARELPDFLRELDENDKATITVTYMTKRELDAMEEC